MNHEGAVCFPLAGGGMMNDADDDEHGKKP